MCDASSESLIAWLKGQPKSEKYFKGTLVLDVGSFDVNGNLRHFFDECTYIGLDVGPGKNVDVVALAQNYDKPDETFDMIVSCATFEHDRNYKASLANIIRLLKRGGLLAFTCAGTGYNEHCTQKSDCIWIPSNEVFGDYYKNLTEQDIRDALDIDSTFSAYSFNVTGECMLTFWGIKK